MDFMISSPLGNSVISAGLGLFLFSLMALIAVELKNSNSKVQSFLWIFFSFFLPFLPIVYFVRLGMNSLKRKQASV
ncbi:hypothetical protein SAMN05421780_105141 [Flexibacter flexilis DSM 6793]|uniref:Phospholipase_D-nuclease N-terminal n=1 Tax=Flexibacter flexilis DSM 6793 TaxID=927664 RepID=A0A1I1IYS1_9BACT|nr:hypothetical protein [Flexibacter flexilis]SFC41404.1 hypothetical protein SAMN05421780_105141 [Flexibacter flexilis DSM 6793]